MGALDEVMRLVRQDLDRLALDERTGAVNLDPRLLEAPDLEILLNRPSDLLPPGQDPGNSIIQSGIDDEGRMVLGIYEPMQSPGIVTLFGRNICTFVRSLLLALARRPYGTFITRPDVERVGLLIAKSVFHHEVFHFHCNVYRELFNGTINIDAEEALATAYERLKLEEERRSANSQLGRMNAVIFNEIMDLAYRLRSAGYRDWVLYADEARFKAGLLSYIKPPNTQRLSSNGVGIGEMLFEMTGRIGGYVERVR